MTKSMLDEAFDDKESDENAKCFDAIIDQSELLLCG